ncbi:MAG: sensor histidine kinase [Eubacterium sp.]|jgi:signal transduction histidine kinase|nr:sensor histidine kinase [Eubacterium sp.]
MKKIIDNIILFIICSVMVIRTCEFQSTVIIAVSVLAVASVILYVDNKHAWVAILSGYMILCMVFPEFFLYLSLILYHSIWYKKIQAYILVITLIPYLNRLDGWNLGGILLTVVLSMILSYYSKCLSDMEKKLIVLRDTSKERDLLLKEKNRELIEKQDYQIHLATLKERNRIAREIHDNVGHMITRSILQVGALKAIHKETGLHSQLDSINHTLNQAMNSIRKSVHNLHDEAVDMEVVIKDIVGEMQEKYEVYYEYDMSEQVSGEIKYCFIAIVKEAMSNIIKHSNGNKITLILREHPGLYQLSIEDNGTIQKEKENGIGLINMRERVDKLQGTIRINNENGFRIFVTVRK